MKIPAKIIADMRQQVDACSTYIDALAQGCRSPEKVNALLDSAMQKIELCCIDLRRMCEKVRPTLPPLRFGSAHYHTEKIYGEVTRLDAGWLDIRLNALKGRLFPNDNQFELLLGLFTMWDENACCHIYALPFNDAGDFLYRMADGMP